MATPNDILKRINKLSEQAYDKSLASYEKELVRAYRDALRSIKMQIADMYEKIGDDPDKYLQQAEKFNRLTNLEEGIAKEFNKLTGSTIKTTNLAIKETFQSNYYIQGFSFEQSLLTNVRFGLLNTDQVNAVVANPLRNVDWKQSLKLSKEASFRKVKTEIVQGLIKGQGYQKTAREVSKKIGLLQTEKGLAVDPKGNLFNSLRIIRTETHRSQSAGTLLGYDETLASANRLGLDPKKIWVTTFDNRTRPSHANENAEPADKEGNFTIEGASAPAPGMFGVASIDINCRCTTRQEFDGLEAQKVRASGELTTFQSFGEWAEKNGISKNKYGQSYKNVA